MADDATTSPRERILHAAERLLSEHGREGVSTRAVSAAAGVQAQTIYRQYGDMAGLLNAVAGTASPFTWARRPVAAPEPARATR